MTLLFGSHWISRVAVLAAVCLPALLAVSSDSSAAPSLPVMLRVYSDYV